MKKTVFKGAGVAVITPMLPDGAPNYSEMEKILEFQIANHTDSIIVCGTTGEASAMNDDEHLEVIDFVVKKVRHRIPVIAGVGSNDTRHALNLSKEAAKRGADALLHVTPYYNKTSQAGLIRHFTAIASCVDLPIILYNVPSRTGMTIQPETYLELSRVPNIVATKEASGNFSAIAKTMALCGDELDVYSGNDDQIVPLLALGAKGVISVLSNICPQETHNICELFFNGNVNESRQLQLKLMGIIDALFCDVNPIPVKEAMNIMGYAAGVCRMPLAEMSDTNKQKLFTQMQALGLAK
ncbi:MAG: 4-hydroxy-tetrahydrodipicolinate synthase [Oscillospiraceae bacterium]